MALARMDMLGINFGDGSYGISYLNKQDDIVQEFTEDEHHLRQELGETGKAN